MDNPFLLHDNRFADAAPTATGTAAGFSVLNIADLRSYTFWQAAAAGTNYLTVDSGAPAYADTLGIVGHNLGTAAALVSLEDSPDATTWTQRLAPFTPTSDAPLVRLFAGPYARHRRVKIVTASVVPYIAVLLCGARLEFPLYFDSQLVPYEEKVVADNTDGKTGNLLGVVVRYFPWEATYKASVVDGDWFRGDFQAFWTGYGRLYRPFLFVPSLDTLPDDVLFCRMHKSASYKPSYLYSPRQVRPFEFKIEGVGRGL